MLTLYLRIFFKYSKNKFFFLFPQFLSSSGMFGSGISDIQPAGDDNPFLQNAGSGGVLSASSFTFSGGPTSLDDSSTSTFGGFGGTSSNIIFGQTPTFGATSTFGGWGTQQEQPKEDEKKKENDGKKEESSEGGEEE